MQTFYNQLSDGASHTTYLTLLVRLTQASRAQLATWQGDIPLGWTNWGEVGKDA